MINLLEKYNVTKGDIEACFYSVPKDLYSVYKDNGYFYVKVQSGIHRHWYAVQKLLGKYDTECDTLKGIYKIINRKY